jgi:hypothetical protein
LELLVPRAPDSIGCVYVPAGRGGEIAVPCSIVEQHGRRYPVRLLTDAYRLRMSGNVDTEYSKRLSAPTPGVSTDSITAFRYAESGGRRLDAWRPLYWGRGYFIVWQNTMKIQWPKGLWIERMRDAGSFSAARIELPAQDDAGVLHWANQFLDREVERPPVTLSVVYPATAIRLEDESIVIPESDFVLVGLSGDYGSETPEQIYVQWDGGVRRSVALPEGLPIVVEIQRDAATAVSISIDDDDDAELLLQCRSNAAATAVACPSLVVMDSDRRHRTPFYSEAARSDFARVRSRSAFLDTIDLTPATGLTVRTRFKKQHGWREAVFSCDAESLAIDPLAERARLETRVLEALRDAIAENADLEIDLGSFGRLLSQAAVPAELLPRKAELSHELRARIRWLLSIAAAPPRHAAYADDGTLRVVVADVLLNLNWRDEDKGLLTRLRPPTRWPVLVMPQVRALAAQLRLLQTGAM